MKGVKDVKLYTHHCGRVAILTMLVLLVPRLAHATWSVIAVDIKTKTIVISTATCVTSEGLASRGGLKSIQGVVVPGVGVAAAQANVDAKRLNQQLIYDELKKGTPPSDILLLLKADPAIEARQFGILDMQGRSAGFSGGKNQASSLDVQGQVEGTSIYFSIQGNILASPDVVHNAVKAFKDTKGTITDRVMAAIEAADAAGGDSRCSCDSPKNPKVAATVCSNKHAHVAYLLRSEPGDKSGPLYQDGEYSLFIDVTDQNITAEEDANPVKTLRMRYDRIAKGIHEPGKAGVSFPMILKEVKPLYTAEAMRAKIGGEVHLNVIVGLDGSVTDVTVIKSLEPSLDQAAIHAAKQWKFKPGLYGGQPVPTRVRLVLEFRVKK